MVMPEIAPIRRPLENMSIPVFLVQQSPRTAFEHMKHELIKFPEWKKKGYAFNYGPPPHPLIDVLATSDMKSVDWSVVQDVVERTMYPSFDFKPAVQSVEEAMPEVDKAFEVLRIYQEKWGFKLFPEYEIELVVGTIGGGGSWQTVDHEEGGMPNGTVTFWQNPDPTLRGRTPSERIIHEMVHMGTEELLAQICEEAGKPPVSQKTKERLVDLIVHKSFKNTILPNYHKQKGQDNRLDAYISDESLLDIPTAIKQFIIENEPLAEE